MRRVGLGFCGIKNFCTTMNLPPPVPKKVYERILRKINLASREVVDDSMKNAPKEEISASGSNEICVRGDVITTTSLIPADLRILKLNANHSRSVNLQAHSIAVEMDFDLLLLQDPYPNFNLPLNSPLGSSQFFSNSLNCAIVCYNRNIICNFRMKTDHTVSVNIKLNQVLLTVINVYFPLHDDFSGAINQLNLYYGINKNCLL
ncbi:hypothetical protein TNIN_490271 [Trichonephila inaurata madagascariensis]|uniref:Uncharacterized protein n=1 Tax=Trichonephila inaurata madagascariensis TaxID=2747483 RepID=A0A8X6IMB1_9ARAC|nr:hypothetical protein TNIN_490271 [Trichonephila inaurata madagascariensis]